MKENLKRKGLTFALLWAMSLGALFAQNITVRGTVVDDFGDPLMGAVVVVQENRTIGTSTNLDGEFTLSNVPPHGHLIVSFTGFTEQTVPINGRTEINIVLQEGAELEELVVVGMGRQRRESVVGAISTVNPSDLRTPSATLSHGFAGQIAGVVAVQRSGEPGADGASFWIRGISTFAGATSPLIFIDGIEQSIAAMNALPPEVIYSFSVLKDATATALYGARGANGVIIITTRTGTRNERATVNVRVETQMTQPTRMVRFADGVTYMELYNEAMITRGQPPRFTQHKIDGTRANLCPFIFPNVDWKDFLFTDWAHNQTANINVRGGADRVTYFMNVNFNNERGMFRDHPNTTFNNNIRFQRYTLQGNIVSDLTPTTQAALRLHSIIINRAGSSESVGTIYSDLFTTPKVFFPPFFPGYPGDDHIRFGNAQGPIPNLFGGGGGLFNNAFARVSRGYSVRNENVSTVSFELTQRLDFLTEGLSARGLASFRNLSQTTVTRQFIPQFYTVESFAPDYSSFTLGPPLNTGTTALSYGASVGGNRDINFLVALDYSRTFGGVHDVGGLLAYTQREWMYNNPGTYFASLATRDQGIAGRITYAFDRRYIFEANFGWSGSENFAAGNRFGFFPSVAIGYNISQEAFWEPIEHIIPSLRFRASWGRVGNSRIGGDGRFPYLTFVNLTGRGTWFGDNWQNNAGGSGAVVTRYGAPGAVWETGTKRNIGMNINLLHALDISVDAYTETREGIFMQHRTIAVETGITGLAPFGNLGVVSNRGIDLAANYHTRFDNGLRLTARGTFTFAQNKLLDRDEPHGTPYFMSEIGRPLNLPFGLVSMGLFKDYAEIENAPRQMFGEVRPGDIRFKDLNGDGVIDEQDRTRFGHPTVPEIVWGGGLSFEYRNFDFGFLLQGIARTSFMIGDVHPFSADASQLFQWIADDRWTELNPNPNAGYPRLVARQAANQHNNHRASDFWLRNGSFFRLKNAEIGYSHRNMRFYMSGQNLFTWSPFTYWDPEQGGGRGMSYPPLRRISLGLQLQF